MKDTKKSEPKIQLKRYNNKEMLIEIPVNYYSAHRYYFTNKSMLRLAIRILLFHVLNIFNYK